MSQWPARQHLVRNALWRHSYTTAVLSQRINREFKLRFEGEEFTAALIHDFGRFALAFCYPDLCHPNGHSVGEEISTMLELEEQIAGANHCLVGAYIVRINDMPEFLIDTVRYHHSPEQCPNENRLLCKLIATADHMARHLFTHNTAEGYLVAENPGFSLLEEYGTREHVATFTERAGVFMTEAFEHVKTDSLANLKG
jgi:HD-like signal output (HDOD) protein